MKLEILFSLFLIGLVLMSGCIDEKSDREITHLKINNEQLYRMNYIVNASHNKYTTTTLLIVDAYNKFIDCGWYCFDGFGRGARWGAFLARNNITLTDVSDDCRHECFVEDLDCLSPCGFHCPEKHIIICDDYLFRCKKRCADLDNGYRLDGLNFTYRPQSIRKYSDLITDCNSSETDYVTGYFIGEEGEKISLNNYNTIRYYTWLDRNSVNKSIIFTEFNGLTLESRPNVWLVKQNENIYADVEYWKHDNIVVVIYFEGEGEAYFKGCFI